MKLKPAIFLDRDGTLIPEADPVTKRSQIFLMPRVDEALKIFKTAGFSLVVITNQTVVARGILTEKEIHEHHIILNNEVGDMAGVAIDRFYVCPHHPDAQIEKYRVNCDCRKPKPGLILRAVHEMGIDVEKSFMIGDRLTDVMAGKRAGCKTVLLETGAHLDPLIISDDLDLTIKPDHTCADLYQAARWIVR